MCLRNAVAQATFVLTVALAPTWASAKPKLKTADPMAQVYQAIYHAAENDMEGGFWGPALMRLDMLLKKRVDAASVRYYRALCLANLERWPEAYEEFGQALAMGDPAIADDLYIAKESVTKMSEVRKHLGWLSVTVGELREGEKPVLLVDGKVVLVEGHPDAADASFFTWPPLPVTLGEHAVEVRAAGSGPLQETVVVGRPGEEATGSLLRLEPLVTVTFAQRRPLRSVEASAPSPSPLQLEVPARPAGHGSPFLGGVAIGLGVSSLGMFAAHVLDRDEDPGGGLLIAGGVAGGAALAVGAAALLVGRGDSSTQVMGGPGPKGAAKAPPAQAGSRLLVAPTPHGVGLVWAGAL